jgi:hypothetical protein
MTLTDISTILWNLPTIYKWVSFSTSLYKDIQKAMETLPDFTDEETTKTWVQTYSGALVLYAQRTDFTQLDDLFADLIYGIAIGYWDAIWYCICEVQKGVEPDPEIASGKVNAIYEASSEKLVGNPLIIIGGISLLLNGIRLIRQLKADNVIIKPTPVQPTRTRGKIRKALKKVLLDEK